MLYFNDVFYIQDGLWPLYARDASCANCSLLWLLGFSDKRTAILGPSLQ